jgi:RimJ/RimL family protein N-acetyltransferase
LEGKKIRLRPKRLSDAHNDHLWRGDAELARLDATVPLEQSFASFLLDYAEELRCLGGNNQRFAIETAEGKHIGNCSYYNLDPEHHEAEIGILIGDRDYWNQGYGTDTVSTLLLHLFEEKRLEGVYLRSLSWNERAHRCFQKAGFIQHDQSHSNGQHFFFFQCHRTRWEELKRGDDV